MISKRYRNDQARSFFNYQMFAESLEKKDIKVVPIDGMSYRGYMKIDHLCTSDKLMVLEAEYLDVFGQHRIIGEPNLRLINKLLKLQRNGYKIILWTCREGEPLHKAIEWCKEFNLVFDAMNDNLPEIKELYGNNSRKISCDIYIDDRSYIPKW
ncbi:hypothetical protein DW976_09405 [Lachnospira eligens]|nr:hypothetical protein DW976_09405 [Lachnospira eligens]